MMQHLENIEIPYKKPLDKLRKTLYITDSKSNYNGINRKEYQMFPTEEAAHKAKMLELIDSLSWSFNAFEQSGVTDLDFWKEMNDGHNSYDMEEDRVTYSLERVIGFEVSVHTARVIMLLAYRDFLRNKTDSVKEAKEKYWAEYNKA